MNYWKKITIRAMIYAGKYKTLKTVLDEITKRSRDTQQDRD